jgi:hypothetical protein
MGIDDLSQFGNTYDSKLEEMYKNLPLRSNGNVDWDLLKKK